MTEPYKIRSEETWEQARAEYLAGLGAEAVCARHDVGLSNFKKKAKAEGWRRRDQQDPTAPPLYDPELDDTPVDFAEVADEALRRSRRAVRSGMAVEAVRWMRIHREFAAMAAGPPDPAPDLEAEKASRELKRISQWSEAGIAVANQVKANADAEYDDWKRLLDRMEAAQPGKVTEVHQVHPVFPGRAATATPLDRERLTKARDKARRRGQHARADELQARLDALTPPEPPD